MSDPLAEPVEVLVQRLRASDASALDTLMLTYQSVLFTYALRLVGTDDLAADVVQDVFIRIWETRESLQVDSSFRAYLFRAVRNTALNATARDAARQRRELEAEAENPVAPESPSDLFEHAEFEQAVHDAVDALPAKRREIFMLVRNSDLTYAEVADTLGISVSAVKTQMRRAMAALSVRLFPFFVTTLTLCTTFRGSGRPVG